MASTTLQVGRRVAGARSDRQRATEAANGANATLNANPMIEMNTTPLIDVLLVLIVMLVITIPPQSHQVGFDLPTKGEIVPEPDPLRNVLTVDRAGVARWNGQALGDRALRIVLGRSAAMEPQPELHFRPDEDARYERVDEVLAMAKRAAVTRMGFVGNERYARF